MKRKALLLFCALSLALAAPAFADGGDELLFGFNGFDYEDPDPSGTYLDLGEGWKALGFLTSVGPLLDPHVDTGLNEYTTHIFDLSVSARFFTSPFLTVVFANGGRARYYEDPLAGGTAATYGTNPPNATAPATFVDGTMKLGGHVDNFVLVYNFSTGQGNFSGDMTLDEGPDLVYIPPSQYAGWILGGLAGQPNPTVPEGYDHQISGECRIPGKTPTTHKTWGAVKALYR
jgi:hypothetical protein